MKVKIEMIVEDVMGYHITEKEISEYVRSSIIASGYEVEIVGVNKIE